MEVPMSHRTQMIALAVFIAAVGAIMLAGSAWAWSQIPADAPLASYWNLAGPLYRDGGKLEGLPLFLCH
jgi:hypothetical protein